MTPAPCPECAALRARVAELETERRRAFEAHLTRAGAIRASMDLAPMGFDLEWYASRPLGFLPALLAEAARADATALSDGRRWLAEANAQRDQLATRVAELEAQHDADGDLFASGRRYERTYAGLRAAELEAQRDAAYTERNRCVAAIVRLALANGWRAGLGRHVVDETPWDPEWLNVVYVDLPAGQASWHVHDSELPLFADLPAYQGAWDGHTTAEKYARLGELHRWRSNIRDQRDQLAAVVERVRAKAAAWRDEARQVADDTSPRPDRVGYAEAQYDCADELELLLPKEAP